MLRTGGRVVNRKAHGTKRHDQGSRRNLWNVLDYVFEPVIPSTCCEHLLASECCREQPRACPSCVSRGSLFSYKPTSHSQGAKPVATILGRKVSKSLVRRSVTEVCLTYGMQLVPDCVRFARPRLIFDFSPRRGSQESIGTKTAMVLWDEDCVCREFVSFVSQHAARNYRKRCWTRFKQAAMMF
jgi:hypothetical protein